MWYINAALKPLGPFELMEIHEKIKKGHISPHDLIFKEDSPQWKPAQEWEEVRRLGFPAFEAVGTEKDDEQVWIILRLDKNQKKYQQEGPLAGRQIRASLQAGNFLWEDLVWKKGLSGWARLADRLEFTSPDL